MTEPLARRMYGLIEPIHLVTYVADEPSEEVLSLPGMRNYWDGYFASRAGALGVGTPPEVVHAVFYNFGPGEVARHIPYVWDHVTPEQAFAARERGAVRALRRILGELADDPTVGRAAATLVTAAQGAPTEGRPLFAGLRTMPVPVDPVARLYHAATLLREHRGDGHTIALVAEGVSGLESHMLAGLAMGIPARQFGRIHHLATSVLDPVVAGLQARGLLDDAEALTDEGRATKARVEALTDVLAAAPYDPLAPDELDRLVAGLQPLVATVRRGLDLPG